MAASGAGHLKGASCAYRVYRTALQSGCLGDGATKAALLTHLGPCTLGPISQEGLLPLHYAAWMNQAEAAALLLDCGSALNPEDDEATVSVSGGGEDWVAVLPQ